MKKGIVIQTNALTKKYGAVTALGANGAGKSTLIKILLGLESPGAPPHGGDAMVLGNGNGRLSPETRQKIGYISDDAGPVAWASADDIARLYSSLYRRWEDSLYREYARKWHLATTKKLKDVSKGQKRLMEFILVLAYRPELLILDEPFNGLDAVNRIVLQNLLKQCQREQGVTILYTTHVLDEVGRLADRLVIARNGKKVHDDVIGATDSVERIFRLHYGMAV